MKAQVVDLPVCTFVFSNCTKAAITGKELVNPALEQQRLWLKALYRIHFSH